MRHIFGLGLLLKGAQTMMATSAAAPPVATADVLGLGAAAPFSPTTYGTDADVSASMMMSRNRKHSRR